MNQHGAHKRDNADDTKRYMGNLALLRLKLSPKVDDGQDQVRAEDNDVPHKRRSQVGVDEQLPKPHRLAEVDDDEADSQNSAANGSPHGNLGDSTEALHAKRLGHRRNDQTTCGQTDEKHEHGDVKAPRIKVSHIGLNHAAHKLHGPQSKTGNR